VRPAAQVHWRDRFPHGRLRHGWGGHGRRVSGYAPSDSGWALNWLRGHQGPVPWAFVILLTPSRAANSCTRRRTQEETAYLSTWCAGSFLMISLMCLNLWGTLFRAVAAMLQFRKVSPAVREGKHYGGAFVLSCSCSISTRVQFACDISFYAILFWLDWFLNLSSKEQCNWSQTGLTVSFPSFMFSLDYKARPPSWHGCSNYDRFNKKQFKLICNLRYAK
jgi:hypothetical protein